MAMGWTLPKGLVMAKKWTAPRIYAIQRGMWLYAIWQQSWNNCENPLTESFGWKQFWKCSKTIPKWPFINKFDIHWNASLK